MEEDVSGTETRVLTKREKRELKKAENQKQHDKKQILQKLQKVALYIISLLLVGFLGQKMYSYLAAPVDTTTENLYQVAGSDWVRGNPEASVTIIEYADFECPACAVYAPLVGEVYEKYKDSVIFIFRHFPLPQYPKSLIGSRAAEAAGRQDKFWEMHDKLYEKQNEWVKASDSKDKIFDYAREMGLDMDRLESDYGSDEVKTKIDSDTNGGYRLSVDATPTFFVNGKKLDNVRGAEDFDKAIEDALSGK